ncbi:hypothetical protein H8356DRAFT_1671389 [Neocallimastix lanati (nom. inval.)]|jgi:hypothetical protein|uniref:Uncharacterized protein n=1 Tax=Neocallimastix californiae TaxID=1754190 RepID=A0A1Y2FE65_9FUNG|nr:hypothetical protein H8356DRAFT_1671389 [Neocallimastix sp. JGI-2020a]ORY82211.1 hypothetical protein LY90DRAFT_697541 [Neocallimastix californiae]|eukprot:ORY82211.1 hypothetical protein LY90DRAFT_697541 [Neocallimastix californiae]
MSVFSQFSHNIFGSFFGKKKQETTREIGNVEDTNADSIPSFSVLNHSNSNSNSTEYLEPLAVTKRTNIFSGNDIESNDTNEIIDYNLKKLRNHQEDVITTRIEASNELTETNKSTKSEVNSSPLSSTTLDHKKTTTDIHHNLDSKEDFETDSDLNSDSDSDSESESDSDFDSSTDTDSNSESASASESESTSKSNPNDTNANNKEKPVIYLSSSPKQQQQQQQQPKDKLKLKHNSIDDMILEDLDLDKLIYNVPPPFIKMSNLNPMDTIPLKRCRDSMSVPANLTKFSTTAMGRSLISRGNILRHSLRGNNDSSKAIPGIRTIELRKPDPNKLSVSPPSIPSTRRHSTLPLSISLSNSFSSKERSAPLSTSLLAIQYEQPSFTSLMNEEANAKEDMTDSEPSLYPFEEEEEEYDIFDYDL